MVHSSTKRWPVIQDILKREGIARQHLNSFDEFLERGLQSIINEVGQIDIENAEYPYKIQLGKVKLQQPRMMELDGSITHITPAEARLRNVSYSAPVMMEASVVEDGKILESRFVHIGDVPVMAKSNACILHNFSTQKLIEHGEDPNDPGGYFIINGSERVIVGLEDLSYNKIIVDREKVGGNIVFKAKVYSSIVGYRAKLELVMKNDGLIVARIPGSPVDIPVVTLMRALGLESDREIAAVVSLVDELQDELEGSFEKAGDVPTAKDAVVYISKRIAPGMLEEFQIKRAETLLDWGLLPHLGKHPENRKEKAQFLGEAACKLLELKLGWIKPDDKDHYGNKVIKFAGQMLADLFRTAFRNLVRDMKYQLERSGKKRGINAVAAAIRPGIITDKLNNAIATGNWGRGRVGVTQLLDRTNYLSTISHLRRIQSPLSRTQPNFEARDLHATHFGRICPSETPEGSNCGLVKNLALSGIISINVPSEEIVEKLFDLGTVHFFDAKEDLKKDGTRIFVDGRLIGYYKDGQQLAESLRDLRRNSKIHPHVGVSFHKSEIEGSTRRLYVNCNAGRVLRPLIIIKDNKSLLTQELLDKISKKLLSWTDLLRMGVLEVIDANEEENCYITLDDKDTKKHTHLEVFPPAILGAGASIIPYPEHNQSPRNTYESAMAKQSLGFSTPMMNTSTYVRQHFMLYPQTPIVNTKAMKLLGLEDRPAGQNCVVAVLPFDGYNIEDAIVLSKASVDRGLGRTFFFRIYDAEVKQGHTCLKGRYAFKFYDHPERLNSPMIKRNGEFEKVTWDEVYDYITEKFNYYKKEFPYGVFEEPVAIAKDELFFDTNDGNFSVKLKEYNSLIEEYSNDTIGNRAVYEKAKLLLENEMYKDVLEIKESVLELDAEFFEDKENLIVDSAIGAMKIALKKRECQEVLNISNDYNITLSNEWDDGVYECSMMGGNYELSKKLDSRNLKSDDIEIRKQWL